MDLKSDHPFWAVRDGLVRVYPPLRENIRCDALVVGGGVSGALLAHALVAEGVDTVVVDRRDIAQGSTSASTGLLQYEIDEPLHRLREKAGRKVADRAYRTGVEAIDRIGRLAGRVCEFLRSPSLLLAHSSRDLPFLRRELAARREVGLEVEWVDGSTLRNRFGFARSGAILSQCAASINPYRFTHHLLERSTRKGLRVFDRTCVPHYEHQGPGVLARTDRSTTIRCRRIFLATGYEAQETFWKKYVSLRSTYAMVSEPTDCGPWKQDCLVWETGDPYLYARRTADGRVLVGGEDDADADGQRRDRRTPAKAATLQRKFARLCPGMHLENAFSWSGVFGATKDGLPFIGPHPQFPEAYFALGFGGNGITFSMMAAKILTDLFVGRKNRDAAMYGFDRVS